jgi:hypothetical protein
LNTFLAYLTVDSSRSTSLQDPRTASYVGTSGRVESASTPSICRVQRRPTRSKTPRGRTQIQSFGQGSRFAGPSGMLSLVPVRVKDPGIMCGVKVPRAQKASWKTLSLLIYRVCLLLVWTMLALPGTVLNGPMFILAAIISRRKAKGRSCLRLTSIWLNLLHS